MDIVAALIDGESTPPAASPSAAIATSATDIASRWLKRRVANAATIAIGKSTQKLAAAAEAKSSAASAME